MSYAPEDLYYAAAVRCRCGAGLAYARDLNVRGAWECSAILLGNATPSLAHDGPHPFMFWEIKGESKHNGTTRPGGLIDPDRTRHQAATRDIHGAGYPPELLGNPKAR